MSSSSQSTQWSQIWDQLPDAPTMEDIKALSLEAVCGVQELPPPPPPDTAREVAIALISAVMGVLLACLFAYVKWLRPGTGSSAPAVIDATTAALRAEGGVVMGTEDLRIQGQARGEKEPSEPESAAQSSDQLAQPQQAATIATSPPRVDADLISAPMPRKNGAEDHAKAEAEEGVEAAEQRKPVSSIVDRDGLPAVIRSLLQAVGPDHLISAVEQACGGVHLGLALAPVSDFGPSRAASAPSGEDAVAKQILSAKEENIKVQRDLAMAVRRAIGLEDAKAEAEAEKAHAVAEAMALRVELAKLKLERLLVMRHPSDDATVEEARVACAEAQAEHHEAKAAEEVAQAHADLLGEMTPRSHRHASEQLTRLDAKEAELQRERSITSQQTTGAPPEASAAEVPSTAVPIFTVKPTSELAERLVNFVNAPDRSIRALVKHAHDLFDSLGCVDEDGSAVPGAHLAGKLYRSLGLLELLQATMEEPHSINFGSQSVKTMLKTLVEKKDATQPYRCADLGF